MPCSSKFKHVKRILSAEGVLTNLLLISVRCNRISVDQTQYVYGTVTNCHEAARIYVAGYVRLKIYFVPFISPSFVIY